MSEKNTQVIEDFRNLPIPEGSHLLEMDDLKMYFHTRDGIVRAVDGVTYTLDPGETLGVVGESGSGKSVTVMTLMGLIAMPPGKIEGGDIRYRGRSLLEMTPKEMQSIRGNDIAMVFQDPLSALNPVYKIGKQVGEGLRLHRGYTKKQAEARAAELLDMVGIPNPEKRIKEYPHQFSGGMRQRVMIAMALSCEPDILIADEPTTALDVTIQAQIIELMKSMQEKNGNAIIMITHDLGVVADMADKIMVMYAGRPVEFGTADEIFYSPIHPYTWGLHNSIPEQATDEKHPLTPIKGNPPSLIDLPPGCTFAPRCPFAKEICRLETPPKYTTPTGHYSYCHFSDDPDFVMVNQPVTSRTDTSIKLDPAIVAANAPVAAIDDTHAADMDILNSVTFDTAELDHDLGLTDTAAAEVDEAATLDHTVAGVPEREPLTEAEKIEEGGED